MVSSLGLGYKPGGKRFPTIYEPEGIAMLHRPRIRPGHAPAFRLLAAVVAVLAVLAAGATPAAAQQGGSEAYTVSGIAVDVTAANANAARDQAIGEAQRKAWAELYGRVTPGAGSAPRLSDVDLARLVQGFSIDQERASATRYVASMTVRFRPDAVRDMLAGSTAQFVEPATKPYVLLPITVTDGRTILWEDSTRWREVWEARPEGGSLVPLVVPAGELDDIAAISVAEAMEGNPAALERIARKYNAQGVVVARLDLPSAGPDLARGLSIDVTRYDARGSRDQQTVTVKADPADRPDDLLARGPVQVAAALDAGWRRDNLVSTGPEQRLTVSAPILRLDDWLEIRKRLAGLGTGIRSEVVALSRTEARLMLTFRGDTARLQDQLARRDLLLARLPGGGPVAAPVPGQPMAPAADLWQLTLRPAGVDPSSGALPAAGAAPGMPAPAGVPGSTLRF